MPLLSVNINKIALIRNSRGTNNPDLLKVALDCERFGAQGITLHPRPDQRHARYDDCVELKKVLSTELNIEGYPTQDFIDVVLAVQPAQVTLVPDAPNALTSDAGWDTVTHQAMLTDVIKTLNARNIRTSLFVGTDAIHVEYAAKCGAQRIELYTEHYAKNFITHKHEVILPYINAANVATANGLGINAGHDLNLDNLAFFAQQLPNLLEVSIGHALVCDAIYLGLENTIQLYNRCLK
ncbi:MAG: pyridoxine 5'-phosphate synthase [Bacteroidia bacterium]